MIFEIKRFFLQLFCKHNIVYEESKTVDLFRIAYCKKCGYIHRFTIIEKLNIPITAKLIIGTGKK